MKVQITDAAGTCGSTIVEHDEVKSVLLTWFKDALNEEMLPDTDIHYTIKDTIEDLQLAIERRAFDQYELATSLGLELCSA